MKRGALCACAVLIMGLWLPWAQLTIGVLGNAGETGTVNGADIGSDVLSIPVGWIAAAAGVVGLLGVARNGRGLAAAAGSIALLVTLYALLAIPGDDSGAGQASSDVVNDKVGLDWGVFAVAGAGLLLLLSAVLVPAGEPGEPGEELLPEDDPPD
jgi:hypothetical protein